MSAGDVPLTELCAICHVEPLKYTCPRCGIHTCSLPCVKRHKQWAQCSGVRDPAAYRKRNDLATPASIDQDFNFITKVERSIAKAGDDVTEKGIQLVPAGVMNRRGAGTGVKFKFDSEITARGINLVRTPQGMSRSKMNKSHWAGPQKGIMWTVEWIRDTGHRRETNVLETKTIADTYINIFGRRGLPRKRKRSADDEPTQSVPKPDIPLATQSKTPPLEAVQDEAPGLETSAERLNIKPTEDSTGPAPAGSTTRSVPQQDHNDDGQENASFIPPERSKTADSLEGIYFYLHKPLTKSKLKCLIPINATESFQEVLKGKILLDFPTVYVREEGPGEIKAPYILEEKYLEEHEALTSINSLKPPHDDHIMSPPTEMKAIDEKTIIEVLNADLGA